jgi:hypothetical protein
VEKKWSDCGVSGHHTPAEMPADAVLLDGTGSNKIDGRAPFYVEFAWKKALLSALTPAGAAAFTHEQSEI